MKRRNLKKEDEMLVRDYTEYKEQKQLADAEAANYDLYDLSEPAEEPEMVALAIRENNKAEQFYHVQLLLKELGRCFRMTTQKPVEHKIVGKINQLIN